MRLNREQLEKQSRIEAGFVCFYTKLLSLLGVCCKEALLPDIQSDAYDSSSDSHSSSSLHSLKPSVFLILLILLITLFITVSIYFLLRRLRRSLLPPSSVSPVLDSSTSGECAICLSPLEPEDKLRHLPLCCHAFHHDCIDIWLVSNKTFSLCRSPLSASQEDAATTTTTASLAADVGHDGSRSWLRDLSRGISSRALSFCFNC